MRAILQRVSRGEVRIASKVRGAIGKGLVVLVGVAEEDTIEDAQWLAGKVARMRLFEDDQGLMNRSVLEIGGGVLAISQFTLFASTKKGNRPSFSRAAKPERALPLYQSFVEALRAELGRPVKTGEFGAMMHVDLVNEGPVTIWIDSRNRE